MANRHNKPFYKPHLESIRDWVYLNQESNIILY